MTSAASWKPPGVGHDGSDWVQLKSGEWLRGEIKYVQNKEVEFDSDELDQQTLKLKDVRRFIRRTRMFTRFGTRIAALWHGRHQQRRRDSAIGAAGQPVPR